MQLKATIELEGFTLEVTGDTPHEVVAGLTALRNNETAGIIGNIRESAPGQEALGRVLGARAVGEEAHTPSDQAMVDEAKPRKEWTRMDQSMWDQEQRDERAPHHHQAPPPPGAEMSMDAPKLATGEFPWKVDAQLPDGSVGKAFVQPVMPSPEFNALPKTADPHDSRIKEGTARFFRYIT